MIGPAISRFDRMDWVQEACESAWLHRFLRAHAPSYKPAELLPVAREGVYQYLRIRALAILLTQYRIEEKKADELLRSVSEDVVVVRPRHHEGAYCLVGSWMISDLGDTHDGEYEQVAPPWKS